MKVLLVHQGLQSFVETDLNILSSVHEVRALRFSGIKDVLAIFRGMLWCDLALCWFGKLHAFFSVLLGRLLGRKTVVISAGDDVANCTIAGKPWGLYAHPVKRLFAQFIFDNADRILAVSEFNRREISAKARVRSYKVELIYHGFDHKIFRKGLTQEKTRSAVTVAHINSEYYYVKGLWAFVESAKFLPEVQYFLVGSDSEPIADVLKKNAPPNVCFTGAFYGEDLVEVLGQAQVYVQASEYESFGCALAEAMLCECVPVVSRRASLPEIVGEAGFYVDNINPSELAERIREALEHPEMGKQARERIVSHFPLERRRQQLLEAIDEVMTDQRPSRGA